MIKQEDVLILDEVAGPEMDVAGYGDLVLRLALEIDEEAYEAQREGAREQGAAYSFEAEDGVVGLVPSVSFIRDDNVMTKSVLVPSSVVRMQSDIRRMVVGIFVQRRSRGAWLAIAGWSPAHRLAKWIARTTVHPFGNTPGSLAIAPAVCLEPWSDLVELHSAKTLCL